MRAPYGRVVVLHLTILVGAVAVATVGAPIAALAVVVVLKTGIDLAARLREHRRSGPPSPAPVDGGPGGDG